MLQRALELGVNFIDTADSYGPEVNERLIAETLHPYPRGLVIATKGGLIRPGRDQWERRGSPAHLRQACEASLKRLRVERIDLYQFHAPDPRVRIEDSVGELAKLQQEGKIRHIGVSNFSVAELERVAGIAKIVSVQNRYNVTAGARTTSSPIASTARWRSFPTRRWLRASTRAATRARGAGAHREAALDDAGAGGAGLAAGALARDAADSRHLLGRPPRGKRRRRRRD